MFHFLSDFGAFLIGLVHFGTSTATTVASHAVGTLDCFVGTIK